MGPMDNIWIIGMYSTHGTTNQYIQYKDKYLYTAFHPYQSLTNEIMRYMYMYKCTVRRHVHVPISISGM